MKEKTNYDSYIEGLKHGIQAERDGVTKEIKPDHVGMGMVREITPLDEKMEYGSGNWGGCDVVKENDLKNSMKQLQERLKENTNYSLQMVLDDYVLYGKKEMPVDEVVKRLKDILKNQDKIFKGVIGGKLLK